MASTKSTPGNPHDKFFKYIFSRKEQAKALLKGSLPQEILKNLELESLNLIPESYVDETLASSFTDLEVV